MTAREQLMATLSEVRDQYLQDGNEFAAEEMIRDAIDTAADADQTVTLRDASEIENLLGYGEINRAISAMLRYLRQQSKVNAVEDFDLEDPLTADIWDNVDTYDDLTPEEVAVFTSGDGVNWAEYPDHEFQEDVKVETETETETETEAEEEELGFFGKIFAAISGQINKR